MPAKLPQDDAQDEPALSAEEKWRHEVFYTAIGSVIVGRNECFCSSRHVQEAIAIFSPKAFSTFSQVYPTTGHVKVNVRMFFET